MKGEGHRDWENVIGRRSLGVNEYIQCHTIFARNVAMIELIYIPYDPTQFGLK